MFTNRTSRLVLLGVAGAAGIIGLAGPAAADPTAPLVATGNLVDNGSFERPALASGYRVIPAASHALNGWQVGGGSVEQDAADIWPPFAGKVSLDLSGTSPGRVTQTLLTTPGTAYVISYALGGNFYCGQKVKSIAVAFAGQVVDYERFNDSRSSPTAMHWARHTVEVVAAGSRERLDFADITPDRSSCGAVIDDVTVVAQPPPALPEAPDVALLGASGAAVAAGTVVLGRRRQRRRA